MGLERMSHTLLSMLSDYNTPLQRKALFPSWSEYSAREPRPNLSFQYAATKHCKYIVTQTKTTYWSEELHHEMTDPTFTSLVHLWHFRHHCLHFVLFCLPWSTEHIVPFSCNLNWNDPSLFVCALQKLAWVTTPLKKTICFWLQIKHVVSLVQSTIEQQQLVAPWLVWKGLDSIMSRIWRIMHYLYCTKELLNSDTGARLLLHILLYLPCCYRVLELIYGALPTKPAFTGWSGTCNCRVTASHHSPSNSDSLPCAMAIGVDARSHFSYHHLSDWVGHNPGNAT